MKLFSLISYLIGFFSCDGSLLTETIYSPSATTQSFEKIESARIKSFASSAEKFCTGHNYNNNIFFIADMSVHSGRKRFFVYDLKSDSVLSSSMVAHGACGNSFLPDAAFSNQPGCGCTSVGKYMIASKYTGRFGIAYKLHGLDSSSSNAYKRNIVLHSYYEVPDDETFPDGICNSLGCPMVSVNFLKQLERTIDLSSKPILLDSKLNY